MILENRLFKGLPMNTNGILASVLHDFAWMQVPIICQSNLIGKKNSNIHHTPRK